LERAVKRSVILEGKRTSVSLEDEFWLALRRIAQTESKTVSELIVTVARQDDRNLSSAIRVYVLRVHERLAGIA
jgi:predicted DNA-binding ribbon-helix-helix protein